MASVNPEASTSTPTVQNRHAPTAVEKQRLQLERLLKDPAKPVILPDAPKEKTIRPPREMMKNVQGSSAGAGSGEFHVYKANRRREYERIKLMEEQTQKEIETAEFERKRLEREQEAETKTAKNRAKRQKKKEAAMKAKKNKNKPGTKGDGQNNGDEEDDEGSEEDAVERPLKKRKLANTNVVHAIEEETSQPLEPQAQTVLVAETAAPLAIVEARAVQIHDEDD